MNVSLALILVIRRVISPESSQQMKLILRQVVVKGTAKDRAESTAYTTAGKTASGVSHGLEKIDWLGGTYKSDVAQFIGFAPLRDPKIEVYVGIKDPHTDNSGAHGSRHAAPVFREIIDGVLREMNVAPDRS